jgi:hypothetical protein
MSAATGGLDSFTSHSLKPRYGHDSREDPAGTEEELGLDYQSIWPELHLLRMNLLA